MFYAPRLISTIPWVTGHLFMFCAHRLIFRGTEGIRCRFHVLRARTNFRRYRAFPVPFSCFALPDMFLAIPRASDLFFKFCSPDSFSAVPRALAPVFMFCAPKLGFGGIGGVGSRFHVLCARTHFRRYRGRRVPFSSFARPDLFSAVPRSFGSVFMFCAPRLFFGGTEGVRSRFHVLRSRTQFRRYRGRSVSFSCFALPDTFSVVPRASGPVFMFCAPGLVFGGTEGVGSRFHVLRARTHFRRYLGRPVPFSCFVLPDIFWRCRVRRVTFLCFARPD
jgi:hypothetical protein